MKIDLNYRPYPWQTEVHAARRLARYRVLAIHRRAGKTEVAIRELFDAALRDTRVPATYAYIAPYANQASRVVWKRMKKVVEPLRQQGLVEIKEVDKAIDFVTGSRIQLFSANNPDALRGLTLMGAVLDEVAQMPGDIWHDVVFPALQDQKGWALFIGTPKGMDLFHKIYHEGLEKPDWYVRRLSVWDTGVFSHEEIEGFKVQLPESVFAREFGCDFSARANDQLISFTTVLEASRRKLSRDDVMYAPRIIGCDPARFGDDCTAVIKRQGLMAFDLKLWRGLSNMDVASRLSSMIREWRPDAVFIDAGGGAGIIDRLRQLGHGRVIEVHFGGAARDCTKENRRAEMWLNMRDWLEGGGSIPADDRLMADLVAPRYHMSRRDRWMLESKQDIKRRGLPSPDAGDALALTFAEDVFSSYPDPDRVWGDVVAVDFDPLELG